MILFRITSSEEWSMKFQSIEQN